MTPEEIRKFREAAQVLLTLLRCISMKRSLGVSDDDHLNFFRLYDGCLMDVAVISWCKFFGSKSNEKLHWERLFPEPLDGAKKRLEAEFGKFDLGKLSVDIRNYRDTFVAHHDLDEAKRAKSHPFLKPLRDTGWTLYNEVFHTLEAVGETHDLTNPNTVYGSNLEAIENHWREIISAARDSTKTFKDGPLKV